MLDQLDVSPDENNLAEIVETSEQQQCDEVKNIILG